MSGTEQEMAQAKAMVMLRHFVRVTGATMIEGVAVDPVGNRHPLTVSILIGVSKYVIVYGNIFRIRGGLEEVTCYHTMSGSEPPADCILSALLLLKNDPTIFDRWMKRDDYYA